MEKLCLFLFPPDSPCSSFRSSSQWSRRFIARVKDLRNNCHLISFHQIASIPLFGLKRRRMKKRLPSMLDPILVFNVDTDRRLTVTCSHSLYCRRRPRRQVRIDRERMDSMRTTRWHQRICPPESWSDRRESFKYNGFNASLRRSS